MQRLLDSSVFLKYSALHIVGPPEHVGGQGQEGQEGQGGPEKNLANLPSPLHRTVT